MISVLTALALWGSAHGATLVSLDSLLERPMDARVREFEKAGEKGRKYLAATAFDGTETLTTRWRAITTMGKWDPLMFRPELDRALVSREWFMRNSALIALLSDERSRAVSWSVKMLEDKSLVVRTQAVRNLIGLGAVEAEGALWSALNSRMNHRGGESLWVRAHIAEALARLAPQRDGRRTKSFQAMLMDRDERLHKWAIMGLENSTGMKLGDRKEPMEIRRQKWLARLGIAEL
jgi:hypothetical protein